MRVCVCWGVSVCVVLVYVSAGVYVCDTKKWKEAGDAFSEAAGAEVKRPVGVCVLVCVRGVRGVRDGACMVLWMGSFGIRC